MKKISIFVVLILCFILQNGAMAAEAVKVAVVDLQRCMLESKEGKRVSESVKKEIETIRQRYAKAKQELLDLQKEIEKQSLMLSLDAKESKQNEYNKKSRELGYLEEDLQEEQTAIQQDATQKLLKDIYSIVETVAKQQAFDLVLEKSTSGLIFASNALDISDTIIEEYNKAKP